MIHTQHKREARAMKLVIIESPYAGDIERNLAYARAALRDCLMRNEAPLASRILYTQLGVLDEPKLIAAGLWWGAKADATIVYADLGITQEMEQNIASAQIIGRPIERRSIEGWK